MGLIVATQKIDYTLALYLLQMSVHASCVLAPDNTGCRKGSGGVVEAGRSL